jgi:hypothetical protein
MKKIVNITVTFNFPDDLFDADKIQKDTNIKKLVHLATTPLGQLVADLQDMIQSQDPYMQCVESLEIGK